MRDFFLLAFDPDPRLSAVTKYFVGDFDDTFLVTGAGAARPLPAGVELLLDDSRVPCDYVGNPLSWHVFSGRGRDVFASLLSPVDSLMPLGLRRKSDGGTSPHWVGVFATVVDCLDLKKATYRQRQAGSITSVSKMVVRESIVPQGVHLYRILGFPYYVVVDDTVVNRVSAAQLVGLTFVPCESS